MKVNKMIDGVKDRIDDARVKVVKEVTDAELESMLRN